MSSISQADFRAAKARVAEAGRKGTARLRRQAGLDGQNPQSAMGSRTPANPQFMDALDSLPCERLAQGLDDPPKDEAAPYRINYENPDDPFGLRARQQKSEERRALDRVQKGADARDERLAGCDQFLVTFRIFACQPMDWDNPSTKELQDALRRLHFLPGDEWWRLQGRVITDKAPTKQDERTEVEIEVMD